MNLSAMLSPIDDAMPAGPNLEYDPAFTELERLATPMAERAMGDSLKAAQEPDWDKVTVAAEALFGRTKDLRVAMHLGTAWTRRQGLEGWVATLEFVRALLEQYWEVVHPQLDADDDHDPTARVNALMPLADAQSLLGNFRVAPFVHSPRMGRYSLRDLRVATGALQAGAAGDDASAPTLIDIEACCMDCADSQLPETASLLSLALEHALAIDALLTERLGVAAPDLHALSVDIGELKKFVDAQCIRRFPQSVHADAAQASEAEGAVATGTVTRVDDRQISGHDDVIRRLDDICEYYARHEPSSPLPVLLQRARRLVGKSFAEVLRDIAPNGMQDLQMLAGPDGD
jgi:type VI secretion system protein ImpA